MPVTSAATVIICQLLTRRVTLVRVVSSLKRLFLNVFPEMARSLLNLREKDKEG